MADRADKISDRQIIRSSRPQIMVTCYDATFARLIGDTEAFDFVLVGDSLGMVIYGDSSTLNVTMEMMIRHSLAVARGLAKSAALKKPILIADMPALSYETVETAVLNAKRLMQAGAQMVKVEGEVSEIVQALKEEDIPVCGHIGLTPQTIQVYKVQGKSTAEAERLMADARKLELAGVDLLVLEMLPIGLAREITAMLSIPTVGIGAGPFCSGQVLVLYDLLGLNPEFHPKFLKKYSDGASQVLSALQSYAKEVQTGTYPDDEHSFK